MDALDSGEPADTLDNDFQEFFGPGMNIAVIGGRGSGKSWTASYVSSLALWRGDYYVASNILCQKWDAAQGRMVKDYPPGYFKTRSYLDLFAVIYLALQDGKKVLFILDEAGALAKGFQKGETSLQAHVRDNIAFMAVSRHLEVCTVLISQSLANIGTTFRSYEGGLLDLVITKVPWPGYTEQQVARVEDAQGGVAFCTIPSYGLAHDEGWAREQPGRIVYSDSVAAFDRGKYPGTRIDFRLRELLDAISDQLPSEYASIIRFHLDHPPVPGQAAPPGIAPIQPRQVAPLPPGKVETDAGAVVAASEWRPGEIRDRAIPMIQSGMRVSEIARIIYGDPKKTRQIYHVRAELNGRKRDRSRERHAA